MTPSQAAQEKLTSPRTEAGRTLVQRMLSSKTDDRMGPDDLQRAIFAIEREAAAATPSLDVERLAEALLRVGDGMQLAATFEAMAEMLAAEYVRLDEGSATPEPPLRYAVDGAVRSLDAGDPADALLILRAAQRDADAGMGQ